MQDYPPYSDRARRDRRDSGYEPREIHDTGATLWVATATVIITLAVLLFFGEDNLSNGGAPFVITPPSQTVATTPQGGL